MANTEESSERIISPAERIAADSLASLLSHVAIGDKIEESPELRRLLDALEYFVPEVLREIHSEWVYESLDGVFSAEARRTGERAASILGQCIFISDQTVTPIHVELQVSPSGDRIDWAICKIGVDRSPYGSFPKKLASLKDQLDSVEWGWMVEYGRRLGH